MGIKGYTYLITAGNGRKYYGVRFAKNCSPDDLWVSYFTSSKEVHELIEQNGKDYFLVEIRKVFGSAKQAREWETKVLKRLNVVHKENWINKSDSVSFDAKSCSAGGKKSKGRKAPWNSQRNKSGKWNLGKISSWTTKRNNENNPALGIEARKKNSASKMMKTKCDNCACFGNAGVLKRHLCKNFMGD